MPDTRAMNARAPRWWATHRALEKQLRACGYDPDTLDHLPDPDTVCDDLAGAIRAWRDANDAYTAAATRTTGWRN